MKRFTAAQMNTCMTTDASACAAAPETSCACANAELCMDTAILAVSIFVSMIMLLGILGLVSRILISLLVLIILVWKAENFILPMAGSRK